jgi:hypothetical protein
MKNNKDGILEIATEMANKCSACNISKTNGNPIFKKYVPKASNHKLGTKSITFGLSYAEICVKPSLINYLLWCINFT